MDKFLKINSKGIKPNNVSEYCIEWKNGFKFFMKKDDLTAQETNVIVNAANNDLWLGGGVAGAIRKKGGEEISRECQEYVKKCGTVKNGEVVPTGSGKFPNKNLKFIFHAVGPVFRNGNCGERKDLKNAFMNCFLLCDRMKLESISLPPISSGIFGYPKDQCAFVFYDCLEEFLKSKINLEKIKNTEDEKKEAEIQIDNNLKSLDNSTPIILKEVRMTIIDQETFSVFAEVHELLVKRYKKVFGDQILRFSPDDQDDNNDNLNNLNSKQENVKSNSELNEEDAKDLPVKEEIKNENISTNSNNENILKNEIKNNREIYENKESNETQILQITESQEVGIKMDNINI
jgi:O-acetyl-ADP-ribose deacetylase (regulator of RNase III)